MRQTTTEDLNCFARLGHNLRWGPFRDVAVCVATPSDWSDQYFSLPKANKGRLEDNFFLIRYFLHRRSSKRWNLISVKLEGTEVSLLKTLAGVFAIYSSCQEDKHYRLSSSETLQGFGQNMSAFPWPFNQN